MLAVPQGKNHQKLTDLKWFVHSCYELFQKLLLQTLLFFLQKFRQESVIFVKQNYFDNPMLHLFAANPLP